MKRLVVCADGTWNEPEQKDRGRAAQTNVVKLAKAVLPTDKSGVHQVLAYHEGVGENGGIIDHINGGAFGEGITRNIKDLYRFLCLNYADGDEVWLFGFSRGAYTARSLAGMIHNCGLLKRENLAKIGEAYTLYRDRDDSSKPNSDAAKAFRAAYCSPDFGIHFIGVWDTVGALGIPVPAFRFWNKSKFKFHDVQLNPLIKFAYHALSVDEKRKPFEPSIWTRHKDASPSQVLEQAWFPGVHCNVGGGYADFGLSDCALAWLWNRAENAGLALDSQMMPKGQPDGEIRNSMTFFYRLLGKNERKLGEKINGYEGVHHTTVVRKEYKPENLSKFLSTNPPTYVP